MSQFIAKIKHRLSQLSFRSGVIAALLCGVCYAISFLQMLLPISTTTKGVLWLIFFGLAKTLQYTALVIFGAAGVARFKAVFHRKLKE